MQASAWDFFNSQIPTSSTFLLSIEFLMCIEPIPPAPIMPNLNGFEFSMWSPNDSFMKRIHL